MVFHSVIFLFVFLPATLLLHALLPRVLKNLFLLGASLVFYAWGEGLTSVLLLVSIAMNYAAGLVVERARGTAWARPALVAALLFNLGLLVVWKYTGFLVENLNGTLQALGRPPLHVPSPHLPVGLSFFTFQAIAYVVDLHRGKAVAVRNPVRLALFFALFPKLNAGPIARLHELADQLEARVVRRADLAEGARRFVVGLAKKVLIADTVAIPADAVFALPPDAVGAGAVWLALACYTLQLYFDFSGYTDMAIGIGRAFGFRLPENFRYPYAAESIRDFWRRWHLSLSSWFRDYLYIPLGGNRHGAVRTSFNLLAVFCLCGLWHGASWTFVAWGLFHGAFLALERGPFGRTLDAAWRPLRHAYVLVVVMAGWCLFRAPTWGSAVGWLRAAAGGGPADASASALAGLLTPGLAFALIAGALASAPWVPDRARAWCDRERAGRPARVALAEAAWDGVLLGMLVVAVLRICGGGPSAFIYDRF